MPHRVWVVALALVAELGSVQADLVWAEQLDVSWESLDAVARTCSCCRGSESVEQVSVEELAAASERRSAVCPTTLAHCRRLRPALAAKSVGQARVVRRAAPWPIRPTTAAKAIPSLVGIRHERARTCDLKSRRYASQRNWEVQSKRSACRSQIRVREQITWTIFQIIISRISKLNWIELNWIELNWIELNSSFFLKKTWRKKVKEPKGSE